jgi:succinyl-CoA synthetase beta subunit
MKLQEYQVKSLFAKQGIPVPQGRVVRTPDEARQAARALGGSVAVKAQVLIGGRGKAGGIRLAATPEQAARVAAEVLDMRIKDLPVRELLIEAAVEIHQEIYLGIVIDRGIRRALIVASAEGGVEIEQVAQEHPEAIHRAAIDPGQGLEDAQWRALAQGIGIPHSLYAGFEQVVRRLYEVFQAYDATLIEINPLVITAGREWLALDGKAVLDDNALYRHPDMAELRASAVSEEGALAEETPAEREAREAGLSYVQLGGEIGCVVNGAGLAMATMDVIKLYGGVPANFLDVGGGAGPERVATALRLVLDTPGLKAVLINIFGGITLCDEVARGIVSALDQIRPEVPMVMRLVGTNEKQGHDILNASGHQLIVAQTLAQAARTVVAVAAGQEV